MEYEDVLVGHGVKPTANRLLVLKALAGNNRPISLKEFEERLVTLDKSSIFRCLKLFAEKHLIHEIEDGSGALKYELCTSNHIEEHNDLHPHFFCERCKETTCLYDMPMPHVRLEGGYEVHSVNYIIKGICNKCR